jgi:hypothetical protein
MLDGIGKSRMKLRDMNKKQKRRYRDIPAGIFPPFSPPFFFRLPLYVTICRTGIRDLNEGASQLRLKTGRVNADR